MNTKALAKLYDKLTPRERVPLIMAARSRGDEQEADRLARSAPRVGWRLPDYWGLAEGVQFVTLTHVIEQLHNAVLFWRLVYMLELETCNPCPPRKADGTAGEHSLFSVVRMAASLLTINAEALRLLAAEGNLDLEAILAYLPHIETVHQAEDAARSLAFSHDEALAYSRERSGESTGIVTVESVLDGMRALLNHSEESWN